MENAFSVLKLEWKQRLIKIKKIHAVVGFVEKRRVFERFQRVLLPEIGLSTRRQILLNKRHSKYSKVFVKNLLQNYMCLKKKERRVNETERQISESKTRLMNACFGVWASTFRQRQSTRASLQIHLSTKQHELKKKVFWLWMRMALLRKRDLISSMDEVSVS